MTSTTTPAADSTLMADLQHVIDSGEKAISAASGVAGDAAASLRTRVRTRVTEAREDLARLQELTVAKAKAAGRATDEFVQENPWKAIGIGAALGLLIGTLAARR